MARAKYKVANMTDLPSEDQLNQGAMEIDLSTPMEEPREDQEFGEGSLASLGTNSEESQSEETSAEAVPTKKTHHRSKRYQDVRSKIDRTKMYTLTDALELLKSLKVTKFDESIDVHLVAKEVLSNIEVAYPHRTGKTVHVEVFSDDTLAKLEKNAIDFDVLLASPAQMGKLTKYARVLGPKGLMPNPKNGTLIANPENRKKELESGKQSIKGEKKAPLLHATVGKISMETSAIAENIDALLKACGTNKVLKMTVCSSMSPGIKVVLQ